MLQILRKLEFGNLFSPLRSKGMKGMRTMSNIIFLYLKCVKDSSSSKVKGHQRASKPKVKSQKKMKKKEEKKEKKKKRNKNELRRKNKKKRKKERKKKKFKR